MNCTRGNGQRKSIQRTIYYIFIIQTHINIEVDILLILEKKKCSKMTN